MLNIFKKNTIKKLLSTLKEHWNTFVKLSALSKLVINLIKLYVKTKTESITNLFNLKYPNNTISIKVDGILIGKLWFSQYLANTTLNTYNKLKIIAYDKDIFISQSSIDIYISADRLFGRDITLPMTDLLSEIRSTMNALLNKILANPMYKYTALYRYLYSNFIRITTDYLYKIILNKLKELYITALNSSIIFIQQRNCIYCSCYNTVYEDLKFSQILYRINKQMRDDFGLYTTPEIKYIPLYDLNRLVNTTRRDNK